MTFAPAPRLQRSTRSAAGRSPWLRRLPGAIAALTLLGAATASQAEALAIELPSMRTPIEIVPSTTPAPASMHVGSAQTSSAATPAAIDLQRQPDRALTRQEVRESLKRARAANIVSPTHEIGDTQEVLAAREAFYALQTEAIVAQYAAEQREQERLAALEADRQLRQALLDEEVAEWSGQGEPDPSMAMSAPDHAGQAGLTSEQAQLEDPNHTMAMREHEIEVTPDTTVAEIMGYMDDAGEPDPALTLSVAEAGEADEED